MREVVVSMLVVLAGLVPAPAAAEESDDFCALVRPGEIAGRVGDAGLDEISGLAASGTHDDVLWAHEDSGAAPAVEALDEAGASLGRYEVVGARAVDWEDIAVGPGPEPDRSYLYIGDIGDNGGGREDITVYRVPEPTVAPSGAGGRLGDVDVLRVTYEGGPQDAEAMIVDPITGDLVVITKQISGRSTILRAAAADLADGATVTMASVGEATIPEPRLVPDNAVALPGTMVTGADISSDGETVLLRTYRAVLAYSRPAGTSLVDALLRPPCFARQTSEPQGEAIAFTRGGDAYLTISEVQLARAGGQAPTDQGPPVNRFTIRPPDTPVPPSTAPPGVGEEPGRFPWWAVPLGGVGIVVAAVVVIGVAVWRRRTRGRPV